MISVYLDVCCLNRPFDDQSQERVHLEATAVLTLLKRIEQEELIFVTSEAVQDEVDSDPSVDRKARVHEFIALSKNSVLVEQEQIIRAAELQKLGFHPFDALHIACAEYANVNAFLTTDDRLLRLALRVHKKLRVKVANPVTWILEI